MEMTSLPDSLQPFPLRIEDYELLDRAGVFEGRRVELIEGLIVAVNAEYRPHSYLKNMLMFRLNVALIELGWPYKALVEATLAIPPHSLPEPDVIVTDAPPIRDYFRLQHIVLVIEVADSTLSSDLGVKRPMYANAGVPEYWVVDVDAECVHRFRSPQGGTYHAVPPIALAGELRSLTMPELAIDGSGIL